MKDERFFFVDPLTVKIREGLDRYRKDVKKLNKLKESITKFKQFHPVLVTKELELISGGRRLAACIALGREVMCMDRGELTDLEIREIELEENLQSEDLSPADEAIATADLHNLKQEIYGKSVSGRQGGWTLEQTAETISMSKGTVLDAIEIAAAVEEFPELKDCKTKTDIKRAAKMIQRTMLRAQKVEEHENNIKGIRDTVKVELEDVLVHMKTIPDNHIDLLLTDPLYEIQVDEIKRGSGDVPGGLSNVGYKIKDDKTDFSVLKQLALESYRFTKTTSLAYIFVAPEHFHTVRNIFIHAGWNCHIKPLIWFKPNAGQCNVPLKWPASSYEMILYARRSEAQLIKLGQRDVLTYSTVTGTNKLHDYEKPVELLEDLILRSVYPGSTLYDPFMGSGSSIVAGMRQKLICFGCDYNKDAYNATLARVNEEVNGYEK